MHDFVGINLVHLFISGESYEVRECTDVPACNPYSDVISERKYATCYDWKKPHIVRSNSAGSMQSHTNSILTNTTGRGSSVTNTGQDDAGSGDGSNANADQVHGCCDHCLFLCSFQTAREDSVAKVYLVKILLVCTFSILISFVLYMVY